MVAVPFPSDSLTDPSWFEPGLTRYVVRANMGAVAPRARSADRKVRCGWSTADPLMMQYHDREWGVPEHDDRRLLEFLILEGAQAGLSWMTVLRKREHYRTAFEGFDPRKIARYEGRDLKRLLADGGIIRNRVKISAAIRNAHAFLEVQKEFGTFDAYMWKFVGDRPKKNHWRSMGQIPAKTKESDAMSADLKGRGFSFVGSTICYAHMQAVGMVNDHLVRCFRYDEV